jgi:hypothetical protein
MTPEERPNFKRELFAARVEASLVTALLVSAVWYFATARFPYSGDTPVVLIGGSLTVQESSTDSKQTWGPHGNGYRASSPHAVAEIALKKDYKPNNHDDSHRGDDDDTSKDMGSPIPVTSAAPWSVKLYAKEKNDAVLLIEVSPPGTDYLLTLLDQSGSLCPDPVTKSPRRMEYFLNSSCSGEAHFDRAEVTTNVGTPPPLTCVDSNNQPGMCRIVFRYRSHP